MVDRSVEFWTPEPIFKGEVVFCLASGPSLTPAIVDRLRGCRVVVVNSTCLLAPWADVLYFTDSGWYAAHKDVVTNWAGLVVTQSRSAKRELPDKVKRVVGCNDPYKPPQFPPPCARTVQQGRSSGHTAISVTIAMGPPRMIALVGYDMRIVDGREHHHDEYRGIARNLEIYASEFVPAFNGWARAARDAGVTIVNCTPGSAITEFPFADLDDVLSR